MANPFEDNPFFQSVSPVNSNPGTMTDIFGPAPVPEKPTNTYVSQTGYSVSYEQTQPATTTTTTSTTSNYSFEPEPVKEEPKLDFVQTSSSTYSAPSYVTSTSSTTTKHDNYGGFASTYSDAPASSSPYNFESPEPAMTSAPSSSAATFASNDLSEEQRNEEARLRREEARRQRKWYHCFRLSFYQIYFDVDTIEVIKRIFFGTFPFKKGLFAEIGDNPDFYGPLWICITLIFALSICGNFGEYLQYWNAGWHDGWNYDFLMIGIAAIVFFILSFFIPWVCYLIIRCMCKMKVKLLKILDAFAYTSLILAPCFIGAMFPIEAVRWILLLLGTFWTAACTIWALRSILNEAGAKQYVIYLISALFYAAGFLTFKFYFFRKLDIEVPVSSAAPVTSEVAA